MRGPHKPAIALSENTYLFLILTNGE
jgi:hypothetical protein